MADDGDPWLSFDIDSIQAADENGNPDDSEGIDSAIMEMIIEQKDEEGNPVIQPARVFCTSPYAPYVEFGTGPAVRKSTPKDKTLFDLIWDWATKKGLVNASDPKARRVVRAIVHKIYTEGITPQPFMRSAIDSVFDALPDNEELPQSMLELSKEIKRAAEDNIASMGINYTGALVSSIDTEPIDIYTVDSATGTVTIADEPPDDLYTKLWDDKTKGVNGKSSRGFGV